MDGTEKDRYSYETVVNIVAEMVVEYIKNKEPDKTVENGTEKTEVANESAGSLSKGAAAG